MMCIMEAVWLPFFLHGQKYPCKSLIDLSLLNCLCCSCVSVYKRQETNNKRKQTFINRLTFSKLPTFASDFKTKSEQNV